MRMSQFCAAAALALAASTITAHAEYVCGVNPNGDNFLAQRAGPGSDYTEVDRMAERTVLTVLEVRGPWRYVRQDENGLTGWAHSRWICNGFPR
jgi:uncharacterized protein YraI